jgi:uncharacterized protein (DUF488 family)
MGAIVFTIGYAGRSIEDFLEVLDDAGVTRVIDVRELPLSRRKGFSKTKLGEVLEAAGIEYVHLRAAGNPYRDKKNDIEKCLELYRGYLDEYPEVLDLLEDEMSGATVALLCVEADHDSCHRSILAARLKARKPRLKVRML